MRSISILALSAAGMLAMFMPGARADESNHMTTFTFSGPVELPGKVLPAGTYVFKLANSPSDRNIVQVFNKDQNHIYGTFLTIPDYRLTPTGKTVITFEERAAGSPEAIKAWFYPGDLYGNEFVYPKVRATELAKLNRQSVPSMPQETASNTSSATETMQAMKQAPVTAQKPSGEEVTLAEEFQTTPPPQLASNTRPVRHRLPKTGSPVPLLALLGLIALGGGASLVAAARSAE